MRQSDSSLPSCVAAQHGIGFYYRFMIMPSNFVRMRLAQGAPPPWRQKAAHRKYGCVVVEVDRFDCSAYTQDADLLDCWVCDDL